jgi:hypothetical protein
MEPIPRPERRSTTTKRHSRLAEEDPEMTLVRLAKEEEGVGISACARLYHIPLENRFQFSRSLQS